MYCTTIECVEGVLQAADTTTGICGLWKVSFKLLILQLEYVEGVLQNADTTTVILYVEGDTTIGICGRCPSNC